MTLDLLCVLLPMDMYWMEYMFCLFDFLSSLAQPTDTFRGTCQRTPGKQILGGFLGDDVASKALFLAALYLHAAAACAFILVCDAGEFCT